MPPMGLNMPDFDFDTPAASAATEFFTALDRVAGQPDNDRIDHSDENRMLATVETIVSVTPVEGADRIELARVRGWDVVVGKGEFAPGDRCVYFEVDSMLDVSDPRFADLATRGVRTDAAGSTGHVLKTAAFRGQRSQGLALPGGRFPEIDLYEIGADVTELLNVRKWDPPIPPELIGEVRGMRPGWIPRTEAPRLQNSGSVLDRGGDGWIATEKIDGESMTVWWTRSGPTVGHSDHGVSTRGLDLDLGRSSRMVAAATRLGLLGEVAALGELLGARHVAVSGEFYGEGIKRNPLRVQGQHFAVFRVLVDGQNLPLVADTGIPIYSDQRASCSVLELAPGLAKLLVPVHDLEFPTTVDAGLAQVEQLDSLIAPGQRAEGVVWRHDATGAVLKAIGNRYLMKHDQ